MNGVRQQAPPNTEPRTVLIKRMKTSQIDIEVYAEILNDTANNTIIGAETTYKIRGATSNGGHENISTSPGYNWEMKGGVKTISSINGSAKIKGTIKIQTAYGPNSKPTHASAYGRGTTDEDKKSGNTSLGFHEFCHQNDYLSYLKTQALPSFNGKTGMSEQGFLRARDSFTSAIKKYFENMEMDSIRRTDEVGFKKSVYVRNRVRR